MIWTGMIEMIGYYINELEGGLGDRLKVDVGYVQLGSLIPPHR